MNISHSLTTTYHTRNMHTTQRLRRESEIEYEQNEKTTPFRPPPAPISLAKKKNPRAPPSCLSPSRVKTKLVTRKSKKAELYAINLASPTTTYILRSCIVSGDEAGYNFGQLETRSSHGLQISLSFYMANQAKNFHQPSEIYNTVAGA